MSSCSVSGERGPSWPKAILPPSGIREPLTGKFGASGPLCAEDLTLAARPRAVSGGERIRGMSKPRALAVLLGTLVLLSIGMSGVGAADSATPKILSLKLNGVVDPFMASYVKRGISTANSDGDAAVLLTIDTPGGLDSSMREIVKAILASNVPVICYT